jgi:hypothetical protein
LQTQRSGKNQVFLWPNLIQEFSNAGVPWVEDDVIIYNLKMEALQYDVGKVTQVKIATERIKTD